MYREDFYISLGRHVRQGALSRRGSAPWPLTRMVIAMHWNVYMDWIFYTWQHEMPLDPAKLQAVESRWGIRFPRDYVDCVLRHQGKSPSPDTYRYGDGESSVVNSLLHFENSPNWYNIEAAQRAMQMTGPPCDIYVFAEDPMGNLICFDYRAGGEPAVVLLDYNAAEENTFVPLAPSFSAFLDQLY
jgi:SMI1 / KNR4 family (SUKH-1)